MHGKWTAGRQVFLQWNPCFGGCWNNCLQFQDTMLESDKIWCTIHCG